MTFPIIHFAWTAPRGTDIVWLRSSSAWQQASKHVILTRKKTSFKATANSFESC